MTSVTPNVLYLDGTKTRVHPRADTHRIPRSRTNGVDYTLPPKPLQATLHAEVAQIGERRWRGLALAA
jgi:hypothetical protein